MGFFDWLFGKKKEPTADEKVHAAIKEKESQVKSFERKIALLLIRRQELSSEVDLAKHDVKKWDKISKAAASIGNESNVREAVAKKLEADKKTETLEAELIKLGHTIDGAREQLRFAQDKIDFAKANHATLSARLESAKIRQDLAGDQQGPLAALKELEDVTIENEAKAESNEDISAFQQDFMKNNVVSAEDIDFEVKKLLAAKKTR